MTVMVCYDAIPVRLLDGGGGVRITRKADIGWGARDPVKEWSNISYVGILLSAEDALDMARAYRERESRTCDDIDDGSRRMICLNMIPGESYSLEWWEQGKIIQDDLWSDWPGEFMAEVESAAKEAMR